MRMEPSFVSSANSPNRNPEQRQDKEGCPTPAANPTTKPYPLSFPSRTASVSTVGSMLHLPCPALCCTFPFYPYFLPTHPLPFYFFFFFNLCMLWYLRHFIQGRNVRTGFELPKLLPEAQCLVLDSDLECEAPTVKSDI